MKKKDKYYKEREIIKETSAYKKILNYIESLIGSAKFETDIKNLRKKYNLPPCGLGKVLYVKIRGKRYVSTPPELEKNSFRDDILSLTEKYGLDFMWADIIEHYTIYNSTNISTMGTTFETIDLRYYLSGPEEMEYEGEKWTDNSRKEYLDDLVKTHPIAILLRPYTSQRDIVEYVKKLYKTSIKPLLEENKNNSIKLGKVRKKNLKVKFRNKYIYKNRNLPINELVSLVASHFGDTLEYTYINKIIKDEGKKINAHK